MKKESNILSELWIATKFDAISLCLPFLYPFHSFQTLKTLNLSYFRNTLEVMKQFRHDLKLDFVREDLFIYPMRKGHFRMMIRIAWPIQLTRMTMKSKKIAYSSVNTTTTTWEKFRETFILYLLNDQSLWMIHREKWTENKTFPRTREQETRSFLSLKFNTDCLNYLRIDSVERMLMIWRIPSTVVNLHNWLLSNVSRRNNNNTFRFDNPSQRSIDVTDKIYTDYLLEERDGFFPTNEKPFEDYELFCR